MTPPSSRDTKRNLGIVCLLVTFVLAIPAVALAANIKGNSHDNTLSGTASNDRIWGFAGDDYILAQGGDDVVNGGPDADTVYAGSGNDTLDSGNGCGDILNGQGGNDHIRLWQESGVCSMSATGGQGRDHIRTDARSFLILPGPGHDVVRVSAGFYSGRGRYSGNAFVDAGRDNARDVIYCYPPAGEYAWVKVDTLDRVHRDSARCRIRRH